ncbi:uncharacterized protein TNCV_2968161 [Trichonephila clavipes]|nr:uncharacterized protein TNCV_2968161 [Trichonephila clavipes]
MKEECGLQNGMKLSLLTSHAFVCNITMVGFQSGDSVERGPAPPHWSCTRYYESFADRKHVVHGCSTIDPDYPPAATPDQLWQRVEAAWSVIPQELIQSLFESMPRRAAAVISNNGGYSGY